MQNRYPGADVMLLTRISMPLLFIVLEYFITMPVFTNIAYSYHYQNKEKALIFRYDNAEHHAEIPTFSYHKHLKDSVLYSEAMSLTEVIEELLRLLLREKSGQA